MGGDRRRVGRTPGKVPSADGKTELSIEKPEDVRAFLADAGVSTARKKADGTTETPEEVEARTAALTKVMISSGLGSRDEMAQLVQTVERVEWGELAMDRLVVSGHHYAGTSRIFGDASMDCGQLKAMVSACNSNSNGQDKVFKDICGQRPRPEVRAPGLTTMPPS